MTQLSNILSITIKRRVFQFTPKAGFFFFSITIYFSLPRVKKKIFTPIAAIIRAGPPDEAMIDLKIKRCTCSFSIKEALI